MRRLFELITARMRAFNHQRTDVAMLLRMPEPMRPIYDDHA